MITRPYSASYERGRRLVTAGCPVDYLGNLPRNLASFRKTLYISQLDGYFQSRILDMGWSCATGYMIPLRIGTDLPRGIIISGWSFLPPWEDHLISWDYDPGQILPAREHHLYAGLFNSRLSAVLNDRHLLVRGRPIEGLLCGCAFQSIPESLASGETVRAKLSLIDDTGHTFALRIALTVERSFALTRKTHATRRRGRLFDKQDFIDRNSQIPAEQQTRRASQTIADSNSGAAPAGGRGVVDVVG